MEKNRSPLQPILLIDDEPHILNGFSVALLTAGFDNLIRCQDGRQVGDLIARQEMEVVLLDLMLPHVSGQEILRRLQEEQPQVPVIILTGVDEVTTAVQCMRGGAFDYIVKPVDGELLLASVRRAMDVRQLRRENTLLARRILSGGVENPDAFAAIVTRNRRMEAIFRYCEAIAEGRQPVLITGETGTGKELVARALHELSGRSGELVAVNVAGLDDHVFSDALFGHARGAFTGADRVRAGLAEKAGAGTLFLDEIGDLSEPSQVKLLRFLENGEFYPLGADAPKSSSARVLAATSRNLEEAVAAGSFRRDLYFRLRTHHIQVPPLRERRDDLPLLLAHLLEEAGREFQREELACDPEVVQVLAAYDFPGNVRELKALVYDAVAGLSGDRITPAAFARLAGDQPGAEGADGDWAGRLQRLPSLKEASEALVEEALRRTGQNQRAAAMLLGITPQALNQRLKRR
ncbi:MAG: sigma-54 dependent transcriptional regulator [Desulfobacteraceae bacterium]|nr:sigma-54 dependent transcriptional regulator [Desulfobacteraceae bacterium]